MGDTNEPKSFEAVETLSELLHIGKDEMNLAEFPMTSLSDRPQRGETSLKFEDEIFDERKKKVVIRRRIIEGSKEYGLPTATDDSVILALIQLTKIKNSFAEREVRFTRHELINLLGWPNKGQSYDRIAQSLHRVAAVTYHFENSWWDNRRKTWTTRIFGILDSVELNDSREADGQGGAFPSRIAWNQIVLDSFQAGYLRSIDFRLCMSFRHAISMRMYRFLGKRFHLRPQWTFDLKDFAYEHIGLSRNYEGGTQIARKLKDPIAELEQAGFLEPLPSRDRFQKRGRQWTVQLARKAAPAPPATVEDRGGSADADLLDEMTRRGVTRTTAEAILRARPEEVLRQKLEVFDWLTENRDRRVGKNPAGYLVKSIEDDYAPPKGFVSRAERDQRESDQKANDRTGSESRREKAERDAREAAERKAIRDYWEALSPREQDDLDRAALAGADPEAREMLKATGPMRRMALRLLRDLHIGKILGAKGPITHRS